MKRITHLALAIFVCLYAITPLFAQTAGTTTATAPAAANSASTAVSSSADAGQAAAGLAIADYNTGDKPNNLGGDFGAWDKDPNDETQGCKMSFEADDAQGDPAGYSVRLDYDVDSPNPAYNGFWMKLNGLDATEYNTVSFDLKGDASKGFTKRLKIEVKSQKGETSPYIVTGITDQWQRFSVPFEKLRKITDWTALSEFVVVFDDINSSPKSGTIFIDNVRLSAE